MVTMPRGERKAVEADLNPGALPRDATRLDRRGHHAVLHFGVVLLLDPAAVLLLAATMRAQSGARGLEVRRDEWGLGPSTGQAPICPLLCL
jgi:hypothetical protein